jgi:hypothetical protein
VSVNGVFTLVASTVLVLAGLSVVVRAARGLLGQRHARRAGKAVTGEVTAIDPRYRSYYGLYQLAPVVRYAIDGRVREARVPNQNGPAEIGSGMELVVDPADPYTPYAVYGQAFVSALAVGLAFTVFGAAMGLWSLSWT